MLLSLSKISWASFHTSWTPPSTSCKLSVFHVSIYSLRSLLLVPSLPSINMLDSLSFLEKQPTKTLLKIEYALYLLLLSPLPFTETVKPTTFTEFTPHVLFTVLPNTAWLFWPPLHWEPSQEPPWFSNCQTQRPLQTPTIAHHWTTGIPSTILSPSRVASCTIRAGKQKATFCRFPGSWVIQIRF